MAPKTKHRDRYINPLACVFCKREDDDEVLYGKFFRMNDRSVHHNCMFFASGLAQTTKNESQGILGFKIEDIRKEVLRGKKLRCYYCKTPGATVGCVVPSCRKTFHFPCGKSNETLHQFFGSFNSYCDSHKPVQKSIKTSKDTFHCHICYSSLLKTAVKDRLYATCCKNNWYHKTCLQKYATSAGRYFFKCPMCNNSSDFIEIMEIYGINIPDRDASWELEENAYGDLLYRPECGASICKCDQGREYDEEGIWDLFCCKLCGSTARHRFCESLDSSVESWKCGECAVVEEEFTKNNYKPQVTSEIAQPSRFLEVQVFNESALSDCDPSCINFDFSLYASIIPSISSLTRALRCVVQLTYAKIDISDNSVKEPAFTQDAENGRNNQVAPFKVVIDSNGHKIPVLTQNSENRTWDQVTRVESMAETNKINLQIENLNNDTKISNQVTHKIVEDSKISLLELNEENENGKRKLAYDPAINKKSRLQEKVINTFNNEQLKEHLAPWSLDSSKNAKKENSLNANKADSQKAQAVKSHSKKGQSSKKQSNSCLTNSCICRYFGINCSKLKSNRL